MAKGPDFIGLGGYGPWPDNDKPGIENDPSPHYGDGYANRAPAGCHIEAGTDYWIDCMVYPERTYADNEVLADSLDHDSRFFHITVGNVTGRKPGPVN